MMNYDPSLHTQRSAGTCAVRTYRGSGISLDAAGPRTILEPKMKIVFDLTKTRNNVTYTPSVLGARCSDASRERHAQHEKIAGDTNGTAQRARETRAPAHTSAAHCGHSTQQRAHTEQRRREVGAEWGAVRGGRAAPTATTAERRLGRLAAKGQYPLPIPLPTARPRAGLWAPLRRGAPPGPRADHL